MVKATQINTHTDYITSFKRPQEYSREIRIYSFVHVAIDL
jgi:hypothetical protein